MRQQKTARDVDKIRSGSGQKHVELRRTEIMNKNRSQTFESLQMGYSLSKNLSWIEDCSVSNCSDESRPEVITKPSEGRFSVSPAKNLLTCLCVVVSDDVQSEAMRTKRAHVVAWLRSGKEHQNRRSRQKSHRSTVAASSTVLNLF